MLLRGHGSCFCFLCVLFWWCCCVDSSQIYFLLWNLKLTHCKLSALKTGLWCIRQTILSHVIYIYIYRMLVSPCPMNSSSLHNMDVMILLLIPGWWRQWWSARHCGSLHRCGHFWSTHDILGSESTILFEQCLARRVSLEQKRRTWHFRGLEP